MGLHLLVEFRNEKTKAESLNEQGESFYHRKKYEDSMYYYLVNGGGFEGVWG